MNLVYLKCKQKTTGWHIKKSPIHSQLKNENSTMLLGNYILMHVYIKYVLQMT